MCTNAASHCRCNRTIGEGEESLVRQVVVFVSVGTPEMVVLPVAMPRCHHTSSRSYDIEIDRETRTRSSRALGISSNGRINMRQEQIEQMEA